MAATPSIQLVFRSAFEGGTRDWSNRHHFSGGVPADLSAWTTLANSVKGNLMLALPPSTTCIEANCYLAGSDVALHTISLSAAGGADMSTKQLMPLEVAELLRWSTDARTSKNHPIYLFTYMRAALATRGSSDGELVDSNVKATLDAWCTQWVTGMTDGTNLYHRAGPNGAVALAGHCETYFSHRDFPR